MLELVCYNMYIHLIKCKKIEISKDIKTYKTN